MIRMVGARIGSLLVYEELPARWRSNGRRERSFKVRCDCGTETTALMTNLRSGNIRSCGCSKVAAARVIGRSNTKHGGASTNGHRAVEYAIWNNMKFRCENPKARNYKRYGGRGIKVCARWRDSYPTFLADMGPRPSPAHSIDRYPNNDGDYEPTNCRWATRSEQERNKSKR